MHPPPRFRQAKPFASCVAGLPAWFLVAAFSLWLLASTSFAQQRPALADLLAGRPDLSQSERRAAIVDQMRQMENVRKQAAVQRGLELGLPLRVIGPGDRVAELMDFMDARPLYAVTTNREAAISTAAVATRVNFGVDGSGFTIGVWDGGAVRANHQEFDTRVNVVDNVSAINHATHVAGTIAASGVVNRARGMSPAVAIDSYDWNNDKSQMTARGASYPGEPGALYLSNHSYGYRTGWSATGTSNPQWQWFGPGTNQFAFDSNFGKYNDFAHEMDALAYTLPYYLAFWSAGNERGDNPAQGASVRIGSSTFSYDSAIHPPGDGIYKGGYDTIGFDALAKNVMTVGAVDDAVTSGSRDLSPATMASFSSWGPTDDGRIKPDIVANGVQVYSTTASTTSSYGNNNGTSMSAPNATGSAQLLISYFDQLFPKSAMRASTLKGLIIHTADDLGNPGPDYRFGWGLMNTEAAAEHIASHQNSPGSHRMVEAQLTTTDPAHSYTFTWDGVSPIRATLTWTDPPGPPTNTHDDRIPRLVNNLDIEIQGPTGSLHLPYVMPYVGNWNPALRSAPATTGKNNTDNVLQVFIENPPEPGLYTASITVDGALTHGSQYYSLLISGSDDQATAPLPEISFIDPESATSSVTIMTIHGEGFQLGAEVSLALSDRIFQTAFSHEVTPNQITARISTSTLKGGLWDVVVTNPDGQQAILPASFAVPGAIWADDFEDGAPGWSNTAPTGSSSWALTNDASRSPDHSYFAPGPSSPTLDHLYSPSIDIPPGADALSFSFWHSYQFEPKDGGLLEFSLDNGPWFSPGSSGSGTAFLAGGYNHTIPQGTGSPQTRNPLRGQQAWSGQQTNFSQVIVQLDSSVFAGKTFRARWALGTDNSTSSPGWYVDDVALQGTGPIPVITVGPYASESPVTGISTNLYLEAENSDGTTGIIYTWTVDDSLDYPVIFDDNESGTANATVAAFTRAGSYRFDVVARNNFNLSTAASLDLVVEQTPTNLLLHPAEAIVPTGGVITFDTEVRDQFDLPLDEQPVPVWTVDPAAGHITQNGMFTAGNTTGGPFLLTASLSNGLEGTAWITVRQFEFADWVEQFFTPEERTDPEISGEGADPDHDGVSNLLEYALGGNPRQADPSILPQSRLEESIEGPEFVFTFYRPIGLTDLSHEVEGSSDLINWISVPFEIWEVAEEGDTEKITIRESLTDRRFLRLKVQRL